MDKYEYKVKLDEMKALFADKKYEEAAEIADTFNWTKIKNINALIKASEIYENVGRYEESKEILLMAYDRSPIGRMILYRLTMLAVKMGAYDDAKEYYHEFVEVAPHDALKYVLKYEICKGQGADIHELISILEELKEQEYSEEWAYELAHMYHQAGMSDKCIETCDELILWFGDGPYVERALELKMIYQPLTRQQEEKYRQFRQKRNGVVEVTPEDDLESGEIVNETMQIPRVKASSERFNTQNLQEELQRSMQQIMEATEKEEVADGMDNIKKLVEEIPYLQIPREDAQQEEIHIETDAEIDDSLMSNFKELLAEDQDGQISMFVPDHGQIEPQVTGQMSIEDVLAEWEKTRRAAETALQEAEQRKLESAKARALQEAGDIMDRLADVIPKLDSGLTPRELLEEQYLGGEAQNDDKAAAVVANMNQILQQEIDRIADENARMDEQIAAAGASGVGSSMDTLADAVGLDAETAAYLMNAAADDAKDGVDFVGDAAGGAVEFSEEYHTDGDGGKEQEAVDKYAILPEIETPEEEERDAFDITSDEEEGVPAKTIDLSEVGREIAGLKDDAAAQEDTDGTSPDGSDGAEPADIDAIENKYMGVLATDIKELIPDMAGGEGAEPATETAKTDEPEDAILPEIVVPDDTDDDTRPIDHLTDEQKAIFSYFVPVRGMEGQICQALTGAVHYIKAGDRTGGNVIIQGGSGSGKTVLATSILKALQKETGMLSGKVGRIEASTLNQKDIRASMKKVEGGSIIIEKAGELSDESMDEIDRILRQGEGGALVILEDSRRAIDRLLARNTSFAARFSEKITVPVFTSDELVEFAKAYAKELGYTIDEMGILALYNCISGIQKLDQATTLAEVKSIVDAAAAHSERGGLKKAFSIITSRRYDDEDYVILHEKDFAS